MSMVRAEPAVSSNIDGNRSLNGKSTEMRKEAEVGIAVKTAERQKEALVPQEEFGKQQRLDLLP